MAELIPFGRKFREKYFPIDSHYTPVNHGSYGSIPIPVLEAYQRRQREEYFNIDEYIRINQRLDWIHSIEAVSKVVNSDSNNIVLVQNATTGINAVLRSYPFKVGDQVLIQSTVYGACGKTIDFLVNREGIIPIIVELNYPLSDDEVVSRFEEKLKEKPGIKLCMFDTITSMPGVRLPFERLTQLCRDFRVHSLIDGAHSIGMIKVDMKKLKPDYYVSNLHKWLYAPRGCALLYVDPCHHNSIHTLPISHSYLDDNVKLPSNLEKTRLVDRFQFIGTTTFSQYNSTTDAIEFRKQICGGEERIQKYCNNLAKTAGKLVAWIWDTDVMKVESDISLVNVRVPWDHFESRYFDFTNGSQFTEFVAFVDYMAIKEFKTHIPMAVHNGNLWARLSAQTYNELEDYSYAARSYLEILERYFRSEIYKKYSSSKL